MYGDQSLGFIYGHWGLMGSKTIKNGSNCRVQKDSCLWCDHSDETSLAVLFHGTVQCTICFPVFYKVKCGHFDEF